MYYTSTNKRELEAYNQEVNSGEGYNGTTAEWAEIIEHPNGADYAILKHPSYEAELTLIESLGDDWFPNSLE